MMSAGTPIRSTTRIALARWGEDGSRKPRALLAHGTGFVAEVWDDVARELTTLTEAGPPAFALAHQQSRAPVLAGGFSCSASGNVAWLESKPPNRTDPENPTHGHASAYHHRPFGQRIIEPNGPWFQPGTATLAPRRDALGHFLRTGGIPPRRSLLDR